MSTLDEIAAWMEVQNEALYECHRLPTDKLDDKEIAAEVEQVRRWIEYLRRLPNRDTSKYSHHHRRLTCNRIKKGS